MKVIETDIPEVKILQPKVYGDERGYFMETWQQEQFNHLVTEKIFVQDNESLSSKGTLRGLHYQAKNTQGKLVRVISGEIFDVAIDVRKNSLTFGHWVGVLLSEDNKRQVWIPEGFAHGFLVTSLSALCVYKCTNYYSPESEVTIAWNDPILNIDWPIQHDKHPILSEKDRSGIWFKDVLPVIL